jgi:hypothetical protein
MTLDDTIKAQCGIIWQNLNVYIYLKCFRKKDSPTESRGKCVLIYKRKPAYPQEI